MADYQCASFKCIFFLGVSVSPIVGQSYLYIYIYIYIYLFIYR